MYRFRVNILMTGQSFKARLQSITQLNAHTFFVVILFGFHNCLCAGKNVFGITAAQYTKIFKNSFSFIIGKMLLNGRSNLLKK